MVEKIKFLGIEHEVVVDLDSEHPGGGEFDEYVFRRHIPATSYTSDDGRSFYEISSRAGEHMVNCQQCDRRLDVVPKDY